VTISSLHIGHASLELAAVAIALPPSFWSSEILELISCASVEGGVEEDELTETVLADGESKLEFLGGYAGDKERPLPNTLPPPSFRADIVPYSLEFHGKSREVHSRITKFWGFTNAGLAEIVPSLILRTIETSDDVLQCKKHQTMPEEFPKVQGGGSLILAWQIRNKRVLVVGGGEARPQRFRSSGGKPPNLGFR